MFCGRTPLTLEHVWPQWVAAALPGEGPLRVERRALGEAPVSWERVSLEITVRRVCVGCNNGWMSELETAAKPILEPLVLGRSRTLIAAEVETAALWCAKTALMFQWTHPDRRQTPDAHYRWLCQNRTPPPNTFVWIAGYSGTRWSGWYNHQILGLRDPGGPDTGDRGYCATLIVGSLAFQVTAIDAVDPMDIEKASDNEPYIRQVWPSRGVAVQLPPPLLLDDVSLPHFADPFDAEKHGDSLA